MEAVPADQRTRIQFEHKSVLIAVNNAGATCQLCSSIACHIDSVTRNSAIMSHAGRAVVKSSTNGYAGGCHPIRTAISNATVDTQIVEVERNAACCVPGSSGPYCRQTYEVFQNAPPAVVPNQPPLCTGGFLSVDKAAVG